MAFCVRENHQWQTCSFQNVSVVNNAVDRSVEQTVFLQPVTTVTSHERNDASNHQQLDCLFNAVLTTKKAQISTLLVPCEGWPVDSPHKGPESVKSISMSWRHHGPVRYREHDVQLTRYFLVVHICVENWAVFGLDNGVVPIPRKDMSMTKGSVPSTTLHDNISISIQNTQVFLFNNCLWRHRLLGLRHFKSEKDE